MCLRNFILFAVLEKLHVRKEISACAGAGISVGAAFTKHTIQYTRTDGFRARYVQGTPVPRVHKQHAKGILPVGCDCFWRAKTFFLFNVICFSTALSEMFVNGEQKC